MRSGSLSFGAKVSAESTVTRDVRPDLGRGSIAQNPNYEPVVSSALRPRAPDHKSWRRRTAAPTVPEGTTETNIPAEAGYVTRHLLGVVARRRGLASPPSPR